MIVAAGKKRSELTNNSELWWNIQSTKNLTGCTGSFMLDKYHGSEYESIKLFENTIQRFSWDLFVDGKCNGTRVNLKCSPKAVTVMANAFKYVYRLECTVK